MVVPLNVGMFGNSITSSVGVDNGYVIVVLFFDNQVLNSVKGNFRKGNE